MKVFAALNAKNMRGAHTDRKIFQACCTGKVEKLKRMVGYGIDILADHISPLSWAIQSGKLEVVKYLISIGAIMTDMDALKIAARSGHLDVVKYLVSIGGDITVYKNEALVGASLFGHLDIVKYLASIGADVSARDNWAIKWASRDGYLEIVKFLVSKGADLSTSDNYPLIYANMAKHFEIVKFLVSKGADVTAKESIVLKTAIYSNNIELVKFFIDKGAHTHSIDYYVICWAASDEPGWIKKPKTVKYIFDLVFDQMKKHLLLTLLSKKKPIHKDLVRVIMDKLFQHKKYYQSYCKYQHKLKK